MSNEERSKRRKLFYERNKRSILDKQKIYSFENKERIKSRLKRYYSTKHGKIMQCLQNTHKRCNVSSDKRWNRYGGRGIKNLLSYQDLSFLWDRDNASSLKKPSLDRKNVNGNYELSNCQFIEMRENSRKDLIKKVCQKNIDGSIVKVWDAITDADRAGFQRPNIIKCCQGKRPSHKGFKWEYV